MVQTANQTNPPTGEPWNKCFQFGKAKMVLKSVI